MTVVHSADNWLDSALCELRALLEADSPTRLAQLRKLHPEASVEALSRSRLLLLRVAEALAGGDEVAWRRLGLAHEVIDVAREASLPATALAPPVGPAHTEIDPTSEPQRRVSPTEQSPPERSGGERSPATVPATGSAPPHMVMSAQGSRKPPTGAEKRARSFPARPSHGLDATLVAGVTPPLEHVVAGSARPRRDKKAAGGVPRAPASERFATATTGAPPSGSSLEQPIASTQTGSDDVEQYAVLRAWCQVHPERREVWNRRYGLANEQQRADLDTRFRLLFQQQPATHKIFEQRLALHLRWLAGDR